MGLMASRSPGRIGKWYHDEELLDFLVMPAAAFIGHHMFEGGKKTFIEGS
jgi:hypothetical protein